MLDALKFKKEEITAAQKTDEDLNAIFKCLKYGCGPALFPKEFRAAYGKLAIKNDILVYCHHGDFLIVAPEELRKEILELCHAHWSAGHFGRYKTHRKVLERFWWPSLYSKVRDFIAHCSVCIEIKPQNRKRGHMGLHKFPTTPLELISIDFLVDLPLTARGNCHILVINDQFSKLIQLYAVKDRTASTAAKCIVDYSLKFGLPYKLMSDQDPSSESDLFKYLMKELGVKKLRTTAYHPQSNVLTEQSNLTTKQYLTSYLERDISTKLEWDCWLKEASYAYNVSVHSSTGYSPAELMFGRRFRLPIDILYGTFISQTNMPRTVQEFSQKLEKMHELAQNSMEAQQRTFATYYDKKTLNDPLAVGDKVFVYLPRTKRTKLAKKWDGQ